MNAEWSPENNPQDMQQKDALAARGYYEAYLSVKLSFGKIFNGASPGEVAQSDLPRWYQKLFSPSVQAGILSASDLFSYRRHQVYIRHSRHTPPAREHLMDLMDALFERLTNEDHPGVRAVFGHFIFVYIHPFMDGNGRIGHFLMNLMALVANSFINKKKKLRKPYDKNSILKFDLKIQNLIKFLALFGFAGKFSVKKI